MNATSITAPGPGLPRRGTPARPAPADTQRMVAERLRERGRRLMAIRKRVVGAGLSVFALMWGVIFVQLVSGHDPALASKAKAAAVATTSSGSTSSGSSSSGSTTAVSTSQS